MNIVSAIIVPNHKFSRIKGFWTLFLVFSFWVLTSHGQTRMLAYTNSYYHGLVFSGENKSVDSLQSEELMLEGVKEKILGNMPLAADYFTQSINADPHNDGSLYELALIKLGVKDFLKAREYILRALEVKPSEPFFLKALLEADSGLNDKIDAEKTLLKIIQVEKQKTENYVRLAELYLGENRISEAISQYNSYEAVTGDFIFSELQKEKIYLSHNQGEKALESMRILLEKYPENTRYNLLISEIYRSLGKKDLAWESLINAQKKSPEDGFLRLGIFEFLVAEGKIKEADSALEKTFQSDDINLDQKIRILNDYYLKQNFGSLEMARKLSHQLLDENPQNPIVVKLDKDINLKSITDSNPDRLSLADFLENKGGNYKTWNKLISLDYQAGDMKAVARHSSKALEFYPNQIILYWYLGNAYRMMRDFGKASASIRLGLSMSSGDKDQEAILYEELGEIYHSSGNFTASDSSFTESIKRIQNPVVLNNFSYYLALRNTKLLQADSMSFRANILEPGNSNYEDTYAWILYKEKKPVKAKYWIQKAIQDDKTSSPTFWDHYGDILFENHELDKALDAWNKALSLGSKNPVLKNKINNKHP